MYVYVCVYVHEGMTGGSVKLVNILCHVCSIYYHRNLLP